MKVRVGDGKVLIMDIKTFKSLPWAQSRTIPFLQFKQDPGMEVPSKLEEFDISHFNSDKDTKEIFEWTQGEGRKTLEKVLDGDHIKGHVRKGKFIVAYETRPGYGYLNIFVHLIK